mmetsp:Transcript_67423/g.181385  ORF Transcript_67423/g.181385 Transcript_67423/m.181385 type:complete len:379 (-) Transcript_67423:277-1413(-)
MIIDVHHCDVARAEATFRSENLDAAFRVASGPFKNNAGFCEANVIRSKQIIRCGLRGFRFGVAWRLDKDLNVTDESTLGLFVEEFSRGGVIAAAIEMTLKNTGSGASISKVWPMRRYPAPFCALIDKPFEAGLGGIVKLRDLLRKENGFLHDGALVATYKIQCATQGSGIELRDKSQVELQRLQGMSAHFEKLFDTGRHADVALRMGSSTIEAHSVILSARSPVFDAMWSHEMSEKRTKCVDIGDLDVASVRDMVKFMYTGKLVTELKNDDMTVASLKTAHRYEVADLVEECIQALINNLTEALALDRLMVADLLGNAALKSSCLDFIIASSDRMVAIQKLPEFQESARACPHLMVDLWSAAFPASVEPASKCPRTAE